MKNISGKKLLEMEKNFDGRGSFASAMNAVVKSGFEASAAAYDMPRRMRYAFSIELDTGSIKNQKQSGRCWMFAALNVMSFEIMKKLNLEDFELSQAYPLFYDKLEKSNYFLESIIETVNMPVTDRLIAHLLTAPLGDGGQWDMFRNLVEKYGVVPKEMMPESFHSSNTAALNRLMTAKLREYACNIRTAYTNGASKDELRGIKEGMLEEIYRTLCIALGKPPKNVTLELRDKDKNFIRIEDISPQDFFAKYISWDLSDYVSLINAPTADKPYHKTYTVSYLGNVKGGHDVRYLNLPSDELKKYAIEQLKDGKPVWFGCDVGKYLNREHGSMDLDGYDYPNLLGYDFNMTKAQRLDYQESLMTHAMVFTGVNLDKNGKPDRWKVENSWGKEKGKKGWFIMSDEWFSEFLYQVLIDKKYLSETIKKEYEQKPIVLKPWDPMGSLAL
ncbi:MAG: C1 family peptidase [Clostridiales bacterium]|nr:C1 family peptidase [Clostridiales bacterium]